MKSIREAAGSHSPIGIPFKVAGMAAKGDKSAKICLWIAPRTWMGEKRMKLSKDALHRVNLCSTPKSPPVL